MNEQPLCNHPDWKLCQKLKKHISGRLWEIWNGINIDPQKAQAYRNMWIAEAGLPLEQIVIAPTNIQKPRQLNRKPCNCGKKIRKVK